ncbi:phosphotransferase [Nocardioides sp. URHA0020]|uniref:phosphotransferase n=1 Tax=Nocardioides sp. URHA0020 TaxID=1380392 RepID=UPI000687E225|nr:phosphotransferase [Nocardioides sp. URHA0020]
MPDVRLPTTIPHGRTARRLEWSHLPPPLRALVERRCGSPVVEAVSQGSGFTPGFASVLVCEDGSRHFVKAASLKAQRMFAEAYREEARKLAALPADAPAAALLWTHDADDWVVLGIEHVEARAPRRPWRAAELDLCVAMTERLAGVLTPPPDELTTESFVAEFASWPAYWETLRAAPPDLPGLVEHLDEAAALAGRFADVTDGTTLVHTDIRDDNLLLATDGRVLLCDWNWPVVGAAWLDTVLLMIGPRGDGLDVDAVLASSALTRDVPAESVDVLIALVTAYFLVSAAQPVPPTSPYIRDAQRWQGEVCWRWLGERRGWS